MIRTLHTFPKIAVLMGLFSLGWMVLPAVRDGRLPSGDGTGALVASDQAASRLAPTGFDHTIAGENR